MLAKRLISLLTIYDHILYRTKNFVPDYRYTINFVDLWSIDEIIIIDISEEKKLDIKFLDWVSSFTKNSFVPIAMGGGISNCKDIESVLKKGADKVVIGTNAYLNKSLIKDAVKNFGSSTITTSIDLKLVNNEFCIYINNGKTKVEEKIDDYIKHLEDSGSGEILINSIDKDGSLEGYEKDIIFEISNKTKLPCIAAGGAGKWEDFFEILKNENIYGACTSNIYHFTEKSIMSAKKYLNNKKILIRD